MIRRRSALRAIAASAAGLSFGIGALGAPSRSGDAAAHGLELGELEILAEQDGLRMLRQRWHLRGQTGLAWQVSAPRRSSVSVLPSGQVRTLRDLIPALPEPWAAINGGFYDPKGEAMGAVIAGGVEYSRFRRGGGSGVLQVSERGLEIVHHSRFDSGVRDALQSIDRIVANSRPLVNVRETAKASARSGVALTPEQIVLVLVAGDRAITGSGDNVSLGIASGAGMPLWAFSRYLIAALGAESALNLDGGVSAQLAANIGGREFRVRGLRGTINAILVRPVARS